VKSELKRMKVLAWCLVFFLTFLVLVMSFADDQVLLAQDHDDMGYMARKLKEELWKMGTGHKFKKKKN